MSFYDKSLTHSLILGVLLFFKATIFFPTPLPIICLISSKSLVETVFKSSQIIVTRETIGMFF